VVDTMYGQLPQLAKDIFWDQDVVDLPITQATHVYKKVNFEGSAAGIPYDISRLHQLFPASINYFAPGRGCEVL